jgi:hypothetical protein
VTAECEREVKDSSNGRGYRSKRQQRARLSKSVRAPLISDSTTRSVTGSGSVLLRRTAGLRVPAGMRTESRRAAWPVHALPRVSCAQPSSTTRSTSVTSWSWEHSTPCWTWTAGFAGKGSVLATGREYGTEDVATRGLRDGWRMGPVAELELKVATCADAVACMRSILFAIIIKALMALSDGTRLQ